MNVGLLVVAHGELGKALVEAATGTLGNCPLPVEVMACSRECDPERVLSRAQGLLERLDHGDGVLVLTDLYGSTPANIACALADAGASRVRVVSGVNLPMLIRVFNYPQLGLDALSEKAASAGRDGVVLVCKEQEQAARAH